ncbi:MAG: hypothetical protein GSR84_03080 [Desulfurococcales archaeon]|nr:hypothetical protein [Desulfurococcales archaeon]
MDRTINLGYSEVWDTVLLGLGDIKSPGVVVIDYNSPDGVIFTISYNIPYSNAELSSFAVSTGQNTGTLWVPVFTSQRDSVMFLALAVENRYSVEPVSVSVTAVYYYLCPAPEPPPR